MRRKAAEIGYLCRSFHGLDAGRFSGAPPDPHRNARRSEDLRYGQHANMWSEERQPASARRSHTRHCLLPAPAQVTHCTCSDQLQQTPSPYPYLARPTVSLSSPYPSPFPADSIFALCMQSMTAGAREQPRAHAVLCGEERETVEKGSAGTRRVFCGDGCGSCWRAK